MRGAAGTKNRPNRQLYLAFREAGKQGHEYKTDCAAEG
jgi:hypothetical protein